ncbi:peptidase family M20/M25/M40 protein [Chloropicon primus]|nr:peptidase family M20/M25/M40 protein [Chloropicon primus]
MCRLACFLGMPIQLADLVTKPKRSILTQSYDARERQPHTVEHLTKANLNGDGFGVGWYSSNKDDKKPCVFTSILPAWNNPNLARLAEKVESPLVFAHVRAAYPGMPVSEQNCHPFVSGKYMFMHNGNIGNFLKVRRILLRELREDVYNGCQSFHSDSAVCFAVFLNQLVDLEVEYSPIELSHKMSQAMQVIMDACKAADCEESSLLNFVVSDGRTVIATKFSDFGCSASLYMSAGTGYEAFNSQSEEDFHVMRSSYRTKIALVASEPITASPAAWTKVPENSMIILSREKDGDINITFTPIELKGSGLGERTIMKVQSYKVLESVEAGAELKANTSGEVPLTRQFIGRIRREPDDLLTGHTDSVVSLAMDGDVMYSGGIDGSIGVWDMAAFSGRMREMLKVHDGPVMELAVTEKYLVAAVGNRVCFHDKDSYELLEEKTVELPSCGPLLTLCAIERYTAFGGQDCVLRAVQQHTMTEENFKFAARAHNSFILCMLILEDTICTGAADTMVKLWNMETMEEKACFRGHKGPVAALTMSRNGDRIFSGSRDNTIRVWDMEEMCCRHTMSGHSNDVMGLEFIKVNGKREFLCSVSLDKTVRLWDMHYMCIQLFSLKTEPTSSILGDSKLYVADANGHIAEWSLDFLEDSDDDSSGGTPHSPRLSRSMESFKNHFDVFSSSSPKKSRDLEMVQLLKDYIAIPSISGNLENQDDCFQAAKFTSRLLEKCGAVTKMIKPEGKNPVVLARFEVDPDAPTFTFYGHYDVQPANEETWKYNPFEVTTVDGFFYGRGTTDNKGPILAFIFAVKELIDKYGGIGRLPMNIALLIEGEEENGSGGFKETLANNVHWFKNTELIVISNTLWIGKDRPCITYGMRGMITLSVEVYGPEKDLHSGNEGGALKEPMTDLIKILSSIQDPSNKVLIPGFYDGVDFEEVKRKITMFESLKDSIDMNKYAQSLGIDSVSSCSFAELLSKKWLIPTLSIVDIRTGGGSDDSTHGSHYCFGPTRFSVIPHKVVGQISIRFVAKQDPHKLVSAVENHIKTTFAGLNSSNKVNVKVRNIGDAWEGDESHRLYSALASALKTCWGDNPLYTYEGGTMPVTSTLEKTLQAPALLIPLGQSTDNPHLANERIRSVNLFQGKRVFSTLVEEVASSYQPAESS